MTATSFVCCRSGCVALACGQRGSDRYCRLHRKLMQMRLNSIQRGKVAPTWDAICHMVPADMRCLCGVEMVLSRSVDTRRVMTLQHDHSGAFRLICMSCNVRHKNIPDDGFYTIAGGEKHCPRCGEVKPVVEFAVDNSRPSGRKSYCRDCCRNHYIANADYWRDRRHRQAAMPMKAVK